MSETTHHVLPARRTDRGGYFFRRLFLTALAAALPVVALFGFSLYRAAREAEQVAMRSVHGHVTEVAARVEGTMQRLDVIADFLLVRDEVQRMDAGRCQVLLREFPRLDPLIANVGVFDLDGRPLCLARTLPVMPPTFGDAAWFRQASAAEGRVLTKPYFSPASRRLVMTHATPLRASDGRRIGVLGLSIDLQRLSETVLTSHGVLPDAATTIVDRDGTVVARHPEGARWIGQHAPAADELLPPDASRDGVGQASGLDGIERAVAYTTLPLRGWRVFAGVPTASFEAVRRAGTERSVLVLLAALLLGTGASWLSARWLARPLQGLAQTARRLAAGDESARADERQPGEIGVLGAEFNQMVDSLVESRNVERAANERFLRVFNAIPVAAAVFARPDLRLEAVNDAFCDTYGHPRDALVGQTLEGLALGLAPADHARLVRRLQTRGHVRQLPARVRVADGEREVLLSAEPIDFFGRDCVLGVQVDITDQQRAREALLRQEKLQDANRAKTEFLSRMSHELRTPLNAILGLSQLVQASAQGRLSEHERHQLELLHSAGEQLRALIDDVLDVARIESGKLGLAPEPLDVVALADGVLRLCERDAADGAVQLLRTPTAAAPEVVRTDPTRLRQVLLNLLSNAVKYNRPGGRVTLDLERLGDTVTLTVADTGIGMSAAQLARLYEPFNRLGRERGGVPGTGIGLVLTRELVELLGGRMTVDSREGEGTTVRLDFAWPRVAPGAPPAAAPPAPADADRAPAGHVLYIEDNPVNALVVEQLLASWPDVEVTIAEDGTRGLRLAFERVPDVVLLDMQLPDMDGIAVLHALRRDERTRALPVIALSASAMPEDVAAARAAGADDYWAKPFDFQRFRAGLRRHLRVAA